MVMIHPSLFLLGAGLALAIYGYAGPGKKRMLHLALGSGIVLAAVGGYMAAGAYGFLQAAPGVGGEPTLVFEGRMNQANTDPAAGLTGETMVISPDGRLTTTFDDRTDQDTGAWDLRGDFLIINKNTGTGVSLNVFIVVGKAASVDTLADTSSAFPQLVARDTTDNTQYDIDWSVVSGLDSVTQFRDEARITSNWGEQGVVRSDAEMQISVIDGTVLGVPYCVHYLVAGLAFDNCIVSTIA